MKNMLKRIVWGLGAAAMIAIAPPAAAQVGVSPMVIRIDAEQGRASGVITLRNKGNQPRRMRLYAEPFTYDRDGFKTESDNPHDLSPFLLFSPRELTIQPGQSRRVRFLSRLLPSLAGKEYRSVIFVEPLQETKNAPGLQVKTRVGVAVYIRHGDLSPQLQVESAQFDPEDQQIEVLVRNEGSATISPRVEWRLQQDKTLVTKNEISAITVIADGERLVPIRLPKAIDALDPGTYQLQGKLVWGNRLAPKTLLFDFEVSVPQS